MSELRGTFAPVPTPFDRDGNLELAALGRHLTWLEGKGLDGALVLGSNGEFPSLTLAERRAVAEAAAGAGTSLRLILNVGSCALGEVLELLRVAAGCGYAAVLCPPPFYFGEPPLDGLALFFEAVLDTSAQPVLLYHIPQVTRVPISDGLLDRLQDHPNLAGVKDSSGDPSEMERLSPRFASGAYLVGHDQLVAACLERGGAGSITAAASVVPSMVRAVARDRGRQAALDAVRAVLERFGLIVSVKTVLRHRGLGEYRCRPPLADLDAGRCKELLRLLAELEAA